MIPKRLDAQMQAVRRHLRKVERWLNTEFPTDLPVRIRVCHLTGGNLGLTRRLDRYYTISLERLLLGVEALAVEVLLHEWAHARSWRPHLVDDPVFEVHHDDVWAIEYGKLYRAYFEDGGDSDVEAM